MSISVLAARLSSEVVCVAGLLKKRLWLALGVVGQAAFGFGLARAPVG